MAITASEETEVEEQVSALKETLTKAAPESTNGPLREWRLPPQGRHRKHDFTVFLSSPERVLLAELKSSGTSRRSPEAPSWRAFIDVVMELLKSSLPTEMSMERARADLSPGEAVALQHGGIELEAAASGAEPVAASLNEWRKLLQHSYTTSQAAKCLHVKDSRIRQRVGGPRPSLFGFRHGKSWLIPRFQIDNGKIIRGIEIVVPHLAPGLHPVSVARWFQTPNPDLVNPTNEDETVSPVDWLRTGGDPEATAALAAAL
jgi:hypothetical protein